MNHVMLLRVTYRTGCTLLSPYCLTTALLVFLQPHPFICTLPEPHISCSWRPFDVIAVASIYNLHLTLSNYGRYSLCTCLLSFSVHAPARGLACRRGGGTIARSCVHLAVAVL